MGNMVSRDESRGLAGNNLSEIRVISSMAHLLNSGALAWLLLLAQPLTAEDKPCTDTSSVSDVRFTLAIKGHTPIFQQGEIMPLELSFTSATKDRYWAAERNYDRSGRLSIEEYCVEPEAPDPLSTYFKFGAFMGGGLGGTHALDTTPFHAEAELNEWRSLAPGHYRLYAISHRVWRPPDPHDDTPYGQVSEVVRSNIIELDVNQPDPAWQSEQLHRALETLAHLPSPAEARSAARILRFLNTKVSTAELSKLYGAADDKQPIAGELRLGLYGSPFRQEAISAMRTELAVPSHPITSGFLWDLVNLQVSDDPAWDSPPKDPEAAQAFWKRRGERTQELMNAEIRTVLAALPGKTGTARALTLNGVLASGGQDPSLARTIRPALVAAWQDLPRETQDSLIQSQWPLIAGSDMLPILRRMLAEPPPPANTFEAMARDAALKHLSELDPSAGREAILKNLMNVDGRVSLDNVKLLSKEDIAKALPPALERIANSSTRDLDYELVDLYADEGALPVIKTALEVRLGKWACAPQEAMLRYVLRVAPEYGAKQAAAVLAARQNTGCYRFLLVNLGAQLPTVQPIAITALDDSDPEVVQNAADALSRWGTKEAESALWTRLKRFHTDWSNRVDELRVTPDYRSTGSRGVAVERALVPAIAKGTAWICPPEKFLRLQDLVWTKSERQEIDGWSRRWGDAAGIITMSAASDNLMFSVLQYDALTENQLCEKVAQLPPGMRLNWNFWPNVDMEKQEAAYQHVRTAASENGITIEKVKL